MTLDIQKFEKNVKIKFRKKSLLVKAFTHKSADQKNNNEKLEFLGDRVIGLVLSTKLFDRMSHTSTMVLFCRSCVDPEKELHSPANFMMLSGVS